MNEIVAEILVTTFFSTLLVASLIALLTGIWLLLNPSSLRGLTKYLDHWYSLRRAMKPLEIEHHEERIFYRHHKPFGLFILIGSLYTLYRQLFSYEPTQVAGLFDFGISPQAQDWLAESFYLFITLGNAAALLLGLLILFRPSLLKHLEQWANRWVSTRQVMRPLDTSHGEIDALLYRHPRITGAFLTLGSLYIIAILITHL